MSKENQQLQDFKIKGELIGTINLTDTFKKVKELSQHEERHLFLFIDNNGEVFSHWDLDRVEEEGFPIHVIKPFRKTKTGEDSESIF